MLVLFITSLLLLFAAFTYDPIYNSRDTNRSCRSFERPPVCTFQCWRWTQTRSVYVNLRQTETKLNKSGLRSFTRAEGLKSLASTPTSKGKKGMSYLEHLEWSIWNGFGCQEWLLPPWRSCCGKFEGTEGRDWNSAANKSRLTPQRGR